MLTYVAPRELPGLPSRFHDSGRFMAVLQEEANQPGCMMWDLQAQTFVGRVEKERCQTASWLVPGSASLPGELDDPLSETAIYPSPDGARRVRYSWKESKLFIEGGKNRVTVHAGCKATSCPDVIAVAWSPDGKRLALTRARGERIHIVDGETGKGLLALRLDRSELPLPRLLSWGPAGIAAYLGQRDDVAEAPEVKSATPPQTENTDAADADAPESIEAADPADEVDVPTAQRPPVKPEIKADAGKINGAHLTVWRRPGARPQRRDFVQEYNEQGLDASLVMEPRGRFLFELLTTPHDGIYLSVFDIEKNRKTNLSWRHADADENLCQKFERVSASWISGTWPVYETLESKAAECKPAVRAVRLHTGPGVRGRVTTALKKRPPEGEVRAVKDDGKTFTILHGQAAQKAWLEPGGAIDASKRWEAMSATSLRRISDGEEIIFEGDGCVHTAHWVFDCALSRFADALFLLEPDPWKGATVRGVQVAHLYHHPGLVNDFFDGKSVAPAALSGRPGAAPRLERIAVSYAETDGANLSVTLLARDGGAGVASVRVWADEAPLDVKAANLRPQTLEVEKPTPLLLTLPKKLCGHVLIMVCNRAGNICSVPVDVPFCPQKQHHIR